MKWGRMGTGKDFDNAFTTLQKPHLYYRMTVDLNNLVVSLWKQELTYGQNMHTHYFPHNSPLLVFQESTLDPHRIRRCLLSKIIMQSRSSQELRVVC